MKKQYTAPTAQKITLLVEGMMAASLNYTGNETVTSESSVLSNQSGWNSDSWTGVEEED